MNVELTAEELALVTELLESAQKELHVEIRRTETSTVKEEMRGRDALISSLLERLGAPGTAS